MERYLACLTSPLNNLEHIVWYLLQTYFQGRLLRCEWWVKGKCSCNFVKYRYHNIGLFLCLFSFRPDFQHFVSSQALVIFSVHLCYVVEFNHRHSVNWQINLHSNGSVLISGSILSFSLLG